MATLSDAIQSTLKEELEPTIHSSLTFMDPVYPMVKRSSKRVVNTGIGRGHNVIKTFSVGVAGGAKFTTVAGSNVLSTPSNDNFNVFDTPNTFPGLDETTAPAYFTSTIGLIEHRGNFFLPHQFLRMDQYNAQIGSVVGDNMKGVATLVAQQECAQWYTDATYMALGDLGTTATTCSNQGDGYSVIVDLSATNAGGRVHRFIPGMLVDLWTSDGATQLNASFPLAIDDVDTLNRKITLRRLDGTGFTISTVLNGGNTLAGSSINECILVIKDSLSQGPTNLNSFIKNSGTLFGIDLSIRSQFKSYIPSSEGAALSESLLNKRYYRFGQAYPGVWLDTAITTDGVLLGLIDNLDGYATGSSNDGRMRFDRNGEKLNPNLGFTGFNYSFNGRPVTVYTSMFLDPGYWYGLQMANGNFVRYVPPGIPGASSSGEISNDLIGNELEFVASVEGVSDSIFMHVLSGSKPTDFVQAPFVRQWNTLPNDPRSMKLSGITEIVA